VEETDLCSVDHIVGYITGAIAEYYAQDYASGDAAPSSNENAGKDIAWAVSIHKSKACRKMLRRRHGFNGRCHCYGRTGD
jgi:hypothetical protein